MTSVYLSVKYFNDNTEFNKQRSLQRKILGNECCKVKKIFFSIFLSENLESS